MVVFVQPGCPACHAYLPVFRRVAASYPHVPVHILDVSRPAPTLQGLADRCGVQVTPSTHLLHRGGGAIHRPGQLSQGEIRWLFAVAQRENG
jgi:thiol-disulfide isomerase/thioredoxin